VSEAGGEREKLPTAQKGGIHQLDKVVVTTPSRLHFALIDLNGSSGRIDGGLGLSLNYPCFNITAELSKKIDIAGSGCQPFLARAKKIIDILKAEIISSGINFDGISLNIAQAIPPHTGLGSGTQLSLGIATAICKLYDIDLPVEEAALLTGRGGTSGIGVAAFRKGGFIIDGGHKYPSQKSSFLPSSASYNVASAPVLIRRDFPDWQILIVIPNCKRISGEEEVRLFTTLCPMPQETAQQLSHLVLMKLLPALVEEDIFSFGEAVNRIQEIGWKKIEVGIQGAILKKTIEFLRNNGAIGVGLSSWGPALYVLGEELETLQKKTQQFLASLPNGGTCFITSANNVGARVD